MIKKVIAAILIATSIFTLAACSRPGRMEQKLSESIQKEDKQALNVIEPADDNAVKTYMTIPEKPRPETGEPPYYGKYRYVEFEGIDDFIRFKGKFIGDYYCTAGEVLLKTEADDGTELFVIGVAFGFMAILKGEVQEGWERIEEGDIITVYFRFIGNEDNVEELNYISPETTNDRGSPVYMDYMPYGEYQYFEYYTD